MNCAARLVSSSAGASEGAAHSRAMANKPCDLKVMQVLGGEFGWGTERGGEKSGRITK